MKVHHFELGKGFKLKIPRAIIDAYKLKYGIGAIVKVDSKREMYQVGIENGMIVDIPFTEADF
jgi:hypothetical protein